jgi:uncharacterized protein YbjQ (UPF0145 family)
MLAREVRMIVVTTQNLPGHRVREVKGQCFGVIASPPEGQL